MTKSKEEILKLIDENKVKYIRLWFTDILGQLKGMSITRSEIEHVLEEGQGFDGSSVEGFVRIEESDLVAMPDLKTFRILPWSINDEKVALVVCDVLNPDGTPFVGDPRYVLRKTLDKIAKKGWTFYCGPEIEYFYFAGKDNPTPLDQGGYFDYSTVSVGTKMRKTAASALETMGIPVECTHHEVAPSQHEIDLRYQEALVMADFVMFYRLTIKELAFREGYHATFMPKPMFGENGSGMHTHQSIFENSRNTFFDPKEEKYHLSKEAKHYIGGVFCHVKEICLVLSQWVNSYKRLVPGYEAPAYISWGTRNRSALIRIPEYKPGKEKATRIELRSPDPACNPYLAFALMLAAGLKGIEEKIEPPAPVEKDIFRMSDSERKKLNIDCLPGSLEEAIGEFEKSKLAKEVLGEHIFYSLIANKKEEWDNYRIHVSNYELEKYLPWL
ncbi:MAG: glutamine synthetase family protein [candidate division Zixibacteria bacterium]|nr:glutamine synthetase family protein [candidate division Zixibacteria bacterium]